MNNKDRLKVLVQLSGINIGILYVNGNVADGYDPEDVIDRLNYFANGSDYSFEEYKPKGINVLGLTPKNKQKSKQPEEY